MTEDTAGKNWKLNLRYGRLKTPFQHFTLIADGIAGELVDGVACRAGPAVMSMKAWATDTDESADMFVAIGRQIGFTVTGKICIYETAPEQPPEQNPHGYAIHFVAHDGN